MCQGGVAEKISAGSVGDKEYRGESLTSLHNSTRGSNILQIVGADLDGFRLRLAGSCGEPTEGPGDLGLSVENTGKGGS